MTARRRLVLRLAAGVLAAVAAGCAFALAWFGPGWQLAPWSSELSRRDLLRLENELRQTFLLAVAAAGLLFWLALAWRRARAAEETARTTAEILSGAQTSQRTERLSKAIEQLAHHEPQVRLGAVYVLERLARESRDLHWPIVELLCAYVREHAAWEEGRPAARLAPDVQGALSALGRRGGEHRRDGGMLDLNRTDLRGADLKGLDLRGASLVEVHLEEASLAGVQLEGADLRQAHLTRADLVEANLRGANLREAHLEAAYLVEAHLENADLAGAHLEGAYLGGAFLEGADLGSAHLDGAYLYKAHLGGASLHGARVLSAIGIGRTEREALDRSTAAKSGARGGDEDEGAA
jgi:hypothetical protein